MSCRHRQLSLMIFLFFSFPLILFIFFLNSYWQSPDDLKSMAVEAVLTMQGKINDIDNSDSDISIRLLVPSKVIGCIIGKSGSIINEIRKRTKADIRISKSEKPKCADSRDELVEVCALCVVARVFFTYILA